jgi:hypothetical protein
VTVKDLLMKEAGSFTFDMMIESENSLYGTSGEQNI